MADHLFIQPDEKLLIERDWGRVGTEVTDCDGAYTLEDAQELFAQDGREVRAFRFNIHSLNIEDVTEDLRVIDEQSVPYIRPERLTYADFGLTRGRYQ